MSFAPSVFRSVLQAVGKLDARVLLTVGRLDRSALEPVPANVHVEHWVEQADVLAEAELVVCHGGSGTVLGALASGVPMVILPFFGDQIANAGRIAECGAGLVLDGGEPAAELRATMIVPSVVRIQRERSFRDAAQRIALEMEGMPAPEQVLDELRGAARSREPR
jgi:UDP:flavonoid glycosyltransferase YjiC (YdhE family)